MKRSITLPIAPPITSASGSACFQSPRGVRDSIHAINPLMPNAKVAKKYFFATLAFAISGLMAWMLSRMPRGDWKQALPLSLVIGGALGNVIDRFMHGHVVDFIQWYVGEHYWPSFNIADCAVVGGAIGIALFGLLSGKPKDKAG